MERPIEEFDQVTLNLKHTESMLENDRENDLVNPKGH